MDRRRKGHHLVWGVRRKKKKTLTHSYFDRPNLERLHERRYRYRWWEGWREGVIESWTRRTFWGMWRERETRGEKGRVLGGWLWEWTKRERESVPWSGWAWLGRLGVEVNLVLVGVSVVPAVAYEKVIDRSILSSMYSTYCISTFLLCWDHQNTVCNSGLRLGPGHGPLQYCQCRAGLGTAG